MHILVVDDDEAILSVLSEVCEANGHTVHLCSDGASALRHLLCCQEKFDLILLDLMLPRIDGWDFLRIKSSTPEVESIPVVVVTASSSADLLVHKPEGASLVMTKPVALEDLERILNAANTKH